MSKYIEADHLIANLYVQSDDDGYICCPVEELEKMIKAEPQADVRPNVRGEWHHISSTGWECSACGRVVTMRPIDKKKTLYNYCPSCGADMRGE